MQNGSNDVDSHKDVPFAVKIEKFILEVKMHEVIR